MKRQIFQRFAALTFITLLLCTVVIALFEPSAAENGFTGRLLRMLPVSAGIGLIMLFPLFLVSRYLSERLSDECSKFHVGEPEFLMALPELRPLAEQLTGLKSQIAEQVSELQEQKTQLQTLTDNMQEGLLLIDTEGGILICNPAALRLLGSEKEDMRPDSVYEINDAPALHELISKALQGTRASTVLYIGENACQLIANPVSGDNEVITGAVLVLLDVTEREQRDVLRREFTSNVSHELKTPLTSIYGIADMIESGMVRTEDISGFARRIRDESGRMISLIEDIIRLSRLDDESFSGEVLPLDLYEIASEVLMQLQPAADAKQITLSLHGDPAKMHGVPVIVEEMLYNLCDNAIKYNKDHGRVIMTVSRTEHSVIFRVEDTGIGIPQADRERIFERFYRVDKSHSRQLGGTGLGLSIVKHGAAFHHAEIRLQSQLGIGTDISLIFPVEKSDLT
ncbi:MAG: PAS domain-containing protein [Oscillospiraceae bacterium]|nr:PAS domain-containing protein [Oscillospiraceae bacterium]